MNNVLTVGIILLLALVGGHLVQLIRLPEVVGYLIIGLLLGPSVSEILTQDVISALEIFSEIALGLILFSIGAVFEFENLRRVGRQVLLITIYITVGTSLCVFIPMLFFSGSWQVALFLGVIAIEISPIATILVIRELNSEGPLTDAVNNILAVNNVVCIVAFGMATFLVRITAGSGAHAVPLGNEVFLFLWEMIGSVALGILLGYVLALWGKRVAEHGEVLILVLGMLLVVVGACHWIGLSSLIATLTLGATLINLEKESKRLFSVLGKTDPPLYAIFFVLAGADLHLSTLKTIGVVGAVYTLARIGGKIAGAFYGAKQLGFPPVVGRYLGLSLIPHAGVAIGLVLQIRSLFPQYAETVSGVILASVLVNEVVGPVLTKLAITRAGEVRREEIAAFEEL